MAVGLRQNGVFIFAMSGDREANLKILGAYLHQDWPDEYNSDGDAIRDIVRSEPKCIVRLLSDEINNLLIEGRDEGYLEKLMINSAGCYYNPLYRGQTYKKWLEDILRIIEDG